MANIEKNNVKSKVLMFKESFGDERKTNFKSVKWFIILILLKINEL